MSARIPSEHGVYDYVVVGGGSAGCVLAARLSENPNIKVCLLEAGPVDSHPMIRMPLGIAYMMRSKKLNWHFHTEAEPALANRRLFWPRGKMLGGSSSSNAMCYTRGHASDYDEWARLGNVGWSYQDVLPYFRRAEHHERGADAFHGTGGPLNVANLRSPNVLTRAFVKAGSQIGIPRNDDFNGARQEGIGLWELIRYWFGRRGLFTSNAAEGGGFVKSRPDEPVPDLQFHFSPLKLSRHGLDMAALQGDGYSLHVCCLRPKSVGEIRLASADPLAAPQIIANYLSHPDDMATMVRGVQLARLVLAAPAFDRYRGRELMPTVLCEGEDKIRQFIRERAETIYHPVGTCKMGQDAMAVVDSQLRVRGVRRLRVVDASIMPTLIGGNTNAPTVMIAEKASELIKQALCWGWIDGQKPCLQTQGQSQGLTPETECPAPPAPGLATIKIDGVAQ